MLKGKGSSMLLWAEGTLCILIQKCINHINRETIIISNYIKFTYTNLNFFGQVVTFYLVASEQNLKIICLAQGYLMIPNRYE